MNNDDSPSAARRDSPLDLAIDRAVRRMMHVDPPPGLRRRVLARLEAPPARASLFPRFAIAAAALAMLVLAVFVARRDTHPPVPAPGPQPAATSAAANPAPIAVPAPAPSASAADPSGRRASPQRARGPHSEMIRMPKIGNVFGSRGAGVTAANASAAAPETVFPSAGAVPEAVSRPEPAAEDAIRIAPLPAIPEISIAPLRIEILRIEPLPIRK
jgi:hypothetical protein